MIKLIRVGDPHCTVRNLSDSKKLIDFIVQKALEYKVDRIEFMGDLFHTHAVKRIEVENFWINAFNTILENNIKILTLCGNHDIPGSKELTHMSSLDIFKPYKDVTLIDTPRIIDNIGYISFVFDNDKFIEAANKLYQQGAQKTLIAHQTFLGSTYDNGFYAEDGIDLNKIPQEQIISGHIHTQQIVGKCHFIGTPKWDTLSDANQEKGIWFYEHTKDGSVSQSEFISTRDIVTPINKYTLHEEDTEKLNIDVNSINYIELIGKSSWIAKMKKIYKGTARIKTKPTDKKISKVNQNSILSVQRFLETSFEPIKGINKSDILNYLKDKCNV